MITVYTDGACSGNPGPGWAMYVIEKSETVVKKRVRLEHCTNNEAEYLAVVHALQELISHPEWVDPVLFKLDSKLVVEQLNGRWKVKEARMHEFIIQIRSLLNKLTMTVQFIYIPREENKADALKYE